MLIKFWHGTVSHCDLVSHILACEADKMLLPDNPQVTQMVNTINF